MKLAYALRRKLRLNLFHTLIELILSQIFTALWVIILDILSEAHPDEYGR